MRGRWLTVVVLALAFGYPMTAHGQADKGKPTSEKAKGKEKEKAEKEKEHDKDKDKDDDSEAARRELKNYYDKGGQKPTDLPPGIAKNLARGKPLPPGIQRSKVPDGLLTRLPKRPGEEWGMVGNRLVSVDKSGIVRQVITP